MSDIHQRMNRSSFFRRTVGALFAGFMAKDAKIWNRVRRPKWLIRCFLPGTSGNYMSVPEELGQVSPGATPFDITSDIDLRMVVGPDDWTPLYLGPDGDGE